WADLHSFHPFVNLDVSMLDTDSMIWAPPLRLRGPPPPARMHFAAHVLGHRVVVWGGCRPTPGVALVAPGLHLLDLRTRRWSTPVAAATSSGAEARAAAAAAQLRRARRAVDAAMWRAYSAGAPGGRDIAVVEAEAVAAVGAWRLRALLNDLNRAPLPPAACAGHAGCVVGGRIWYIGGWGDGREEQRRGGAAAWPATAGPPDERERRLLDEYHNRLEAERQRRTQEESRRLRRASAAEARRR
ncbi:unnamed protein product, partial [Phaeothamnion confervicola]